MGGGAAGGGARGGARVPARPRRRFRGGHQAALLPRGRGEASGFQGASCPSPQPRRPTPLPAHQVRVGGCAPEELQEAGQGPQEDQPPPLPSTRSHRPSFGEGGLGLCLGGFLSPSIPPPFPLHLPCAPACSPRTQPLSLVPPGLGTHPIRGGAGAAPQSFARVLVVGVAGTGHRVGGEDPTPPEAVLALLFLRIPESPGLALTSVIVTQM